MNSELKLNLKKTVAKSRMDSSNKLDYDLQAYRTTLKTPLGMSPDRLIFGKYCHLLVKLEYKTYWAVKELKMNLKAIRKKRLLQLIELEEFKLNAYKSAHLYKEKNQVLA